MTLAELKRQAKINTNIRPDGTLEIYLGDKILAEISDGTDNEEFIAEILYDMGYIWNEDGTITERKNR